MAQKYKAKSKSRIAPTRSGVPGRPAYKGREEKYLISALGEESLKNIVEQIAEVVRQHGLQKYPDVCRKLFYYMADVVDGWNRV